MKLSSTIKQEKSSWWSERMATSFEKRFQPPSKLGELLTSGTLTSSQEPYTSECICGDQCDVQCYSSTINAVITLISLQLAFT